jgi:hypothetical protein
MLTIEPPPAAAITGPFVGMVQKPASSQNTTTLGSRRISSSIASRIASR